MFGPWTWMTSVDLSAHLGHILLSTTSGCPWVSTGAQPKMITLMALFNPRCLKNILHFPVRVVFHKHISSYFFTFCSCVVICWLASVDFVFLVNLLGFPPKPTTTPGPTTTRDPIADFCRGRPDGLYENIADKTTYFQCFKGNTYLHHCQPGLIYWDSCKCCNWP